MITVRILFYSLLVIGIPEVLLAQGESRKDVRAMHKAAFELGKKYPDSSLSILSSAYSIVKDKGYTWEEAFTQYLIGRTHMVSGQDALAMRYLNEAQRQFSSSDTTDLYNEYVMFWNMARISYRNGSFNSAIDLYDSAYNKLIEFNQYQPREAHKLKAEEKTYNVLYFQSLALKRVGRLKQATEKLIDITKADTKSKPRVFNQIGLIHKDLGDFEKATQYFLKVIDDHNSSPYYLTLATHNLGYTALLQGNLGEAQTHLENSINKAELLVAKKNSIANQRQLFVSLLDKGELLYRLKRAKEAIACWEKALQVYPQFVTNPDHYIIYNWLNLAYMPFDQEKALEFNKKYLETNNSMLKNRAAVTTELEAQLFRSEVNRLNSSEVHKVEVSSLKTFYQKHMLVLIVSGLIVFLTIIWYFAFYRRSKLAQKADEIVKRRSFTASELLD